MTPDPPNLDLSAQLERARNDLMLASSAFDVAQRFARAVEEILRSEALRVQEARNRLALLEIKIASSAGVQDSVSIAPKA